MSNKPSKKKSYGYTAPQQSSGSSRTGLIVIGVVVAVVVIAGVVALVVTSEGGGSTDAVQETAAVVVTGDDLPSYPADGGLIADPSTDPAVGETPPTLEGESFDASSITIDPGADAPMVVIFAAHWCPHCQKEVPLIQKWIADGNLPDDVQVRLVSTGAQANRSEYPPSQWLDGVDWSGDVLLDNADQTAGLAYGLTGYPYIVFVDANGQVVQRTSGELPIEDFATFVDQIAAS